MDNAQENGASAATLTPGVHLAGDSAANSTRDIVDAINQGAIDAQCIAYRIKTLARCADDVLDHPCEDVEIRNRFGRLGDLVAMILEQAERARATCEEIEVAAFGLRVPRG